MCNRPTSLCCLPQMPASVSAARGPRVIRSGPGGLAEGLGDYGPLELAPQQWGWLLHPRLLLQPPLQRQHPRVAASHHAQMQMMAKVPNGHPARHRQQLLFPASARGSQPAHIPACRVDYQDGSGRLCILTCLFQHFYN